MPEGNHNQLGRWSPREMEISNISFIISWCLRSFLVCHNFILFNLLQRLTHKSSYIIGVWFPYYCIAGDLFASNKGILVTSKLITVDPVTPDVWRFSGSKLKNFSDEARRVTNLDIKTFTISEMRGFLSTIKGSPEVIWLVIMNQTEFGVQLVANIKKKFYVSALRFAAYPSNHFKTRPSYDTPKQSVVIRNSTKGSRNLFWITLVAWKENSNGWQAM